MVDGGFATHRRIHLRQQRSGHLHKRHTTHVAGGGKTGHVTHHTAAQGEQHGLAVGTTLQQRVKNQVQRLPVFIGFTVRQGDRVDVLVLRRQRRLQLLRIKWCHRGVGHDQGRGGLGHRLVGCGVGQQPGTDRDGVTAVVKINVHPLRSGGG